MEWKKNKIEQRDSLKQYHPDSIVKYREKRMARKKKRDCCAECNCKDSI